MRRIPTWFAALGVLAFLPGASAEILPIPPLPGERPLRLTFEILPGKPGTKLPAELRAFEGGRLTTEATLVAGKRYRKTTVVLPLPDGDTRERVIFFAEEEAGVRMIGFHRIRRHHDSPQGETIVFNPGPGNPMQGRAEQVPPDTYTPLSLFSALGGVTSPWRAHLWRDGKPATAIRVAFEGEEDLPLLGTSIRCRRLRLEGSEPALFWFAASPPNSFLQYRGPGEILTESGDAGPPILLRATSSSEQVERIFGSP